MNTKKQVDGLCLPDTNTAPITCFAWSPDSRHIATGHDSKDSCVRIWDVEKRAIQKTFPEDESRVTAIAYSPAQPIIVWTTLSRKLRITYLDSDEIWTLPESLNSETAILSFSPDGDSLAIAGRRDSDLRVFNMKRREFERSLKLHSGTNPAAEFSSSGALGIFQSLSKLAIVKFKDNLQKKQQLT